MSKKSDAKVTRVRNAIIGFVVLLVVAVIGYGMLYSSGATQGEFIAGEHYTVLEAPPRRRMGDPIEVREFFSYGCVHCRNFDPLIEDWDATKPANVTFERTPVTFSPIWALLAQTYLTLEHLDIVDDNHARLFRHIHENRGQFLSAEAVADFVDGNGASREEFLEAFNSAEVRRALRAADTAQRTAGISAVPTIVVADKYLVTMDHGRKVALEIVDHLIALEQGAGST